MEKQFNEVLEYLKKLEIRGCITGSCLLGYIEGGKQDIDIFTYDEKAFTELYYHLYHNKMFTIINPLEKWKSDQFRNKNTFGNKHVSGVQSIKFTYNTCIDVNIISKKDCSNAFSVLASFDMDIICKAYCLQAKQYLDLTGNSGETKIANVNRWNPAFNSDEIWQISRILRQLERCFKYYKRGWNTDLVILKYISLIDKVEEFNNIFHSENFDARLKVTKENVKIVKKICETWLETHEISEETINKLQEKIKEI